MAELTDKQKELIEEAGWINASMIIEVQGNDKKYIKESLEKMVERFSNEKGAQLYDRKYEELQELQENWYSIHVELKFIAKDFGILTHIALLYSPSAFEIYEPKEVKIKVGEAQNILVDISNLVTSLAHTVYAQQGHLRKIYSEKAKKQGKKP